MRQKLLYCAARGAHACTRQQEVRARQFELMMEDPRLTNEPVTVECLLRGARRGGGDSLLMIADWIEHGCV